MRDALEDVAPAVPPTAAQLARILAAFDDLPTLLGRRGHVWIGTASGTAPRLSSIRCRLPPGRRCGSGVAYRY
jgi:hypothetical protein